VTATPSRDPLATGLGALATGVGLGGATITLAQGVVAELRTRLDPADYRPVGDPLLAGLLAGVVLAAFFAWRRSRPIENVWQRGVIGVLSAVGALIVGFLAALAHYAGGTVGLVVWGCASLALGIAGSRWAMKGAGSGEPGAGGL
jgi:hypothetical protein